MPTKAKVRSYTKSDGTQVKAHDRSAPPGGRDIGEWWRYARSSDGLKAGGAALGSAAGGAAVWGATAVFSVTAVLLCVVSVASLGLLGWMLGKYKPQRRYRAWKKRMRKRLNPIARFSTTRRASTERKAGQW